MSVPEPPSASGAAAASEHVDEVEPRREGRRFSVRLPTTFVAPALCIYCTAPSEAFETFSERPPVRLAVCEACRGAVARNATMTWSENAASLVLGGAVAAYGLVHFGLEFLGLQALAIVVASVAIPLVARTWRSPGPRSPEVRRSGDELLVVVSGRAASESLGGEVRLASGTTTLPHGSLWPAGVAVGLWVLALLLGTTELWVFHPEPGTVLVIDGRVAGRPLAALEEASSAGLRVRLFSGGHDIALLSAEGEELLSVKGRLGAGESHLLAAPPPRRCFFEERVDGDVRELRRIEAPEGLARLARSPDAWMSPLPAAVAGVGAGRSSAVRLLDCSTKALSR